VPDHVFRARFGQGLEQAFGDQIESLRRKGLLEWAPEGEAQGVAGSAGRRLRLTRAGRLLGNQVFVEFV
jgi:hypothetical protein